MSNDPAPSANSSGLFLPYSGAFGGGQGKLLYANEDRRIRRMDLATRHVQVLQTENVDMKFSAHEGITRSASGRFAAIYKWGRDHYDVFVYDETNEGGTLVYKESVKTEPISGAIISPDGRRVAWSGSVENLGLGAIFDRAIRLFVVDLATRRTTTADLSPMMPINDSPKENAAPVWLNSTEIAVLSDKGVHGFNADSGALRQIAAMTLAAPDVASLSPDGKTIWFHQQRGNAYGRTVWSMNVGEWIPKRRSMIESGGGQEYPSLSPDGQWLMVNYGNAETALPTLGVFTWPQSVFRVTPEPVNTDSSKGFLLDSGGNLVRNMGRVAWY